MIGAGFYLFERFENTLQIFLGDMYIETAHPHRQLSWLGASPRFNADLQIDLSTIRDKGYRLAYHVEKSLFDLSDV